MDKPEKRKKFLDRKEAVKYIEAELTKGTPRKDILQQLSQQYYGKHSIAMLIASIPNPELKRKYKILNDILLGLLLLIILNKLWYSVILLSNFSFAAVPFIIQLVFNIYFAYEVTKYNARIYNLIGILALVGIWYLISNLGDTANGVAIILGVLLNLIIAILAFYLSLKIFPNYGFFGPKKDAKGNIILE